VTDKSSDNHAMQQDLGDGERIKQGSPYELIKEDGGKLQRLCMAGGLEEYRHLVSLAEQSRGKFGGEQ